MFQFATFALHTYVFSVQWPYGRVSPFGNLRINVCLLTPRSLSQATTSFIAWYRQGIHHVHLVTCPYNFDFWCLALFLKLGSSPKSSYSSLLLMSITLAFAVAQVSLYFNCSNLLLNRRYLDYFYYFVCLIQSQPFHKFVNDFHHQLLYEIILIISTFTSS